MFGCNQRRLLGIAAVCVGGGIALSLILPSWILAILLAVIVVAVGILYLVC